MEVNTDQLGKELVKLLEQYSEDVSEKVSDAVIKTAKESAKGLKAVTQVAGSNRWTKYPASWTATTKVKKGQTIAEVHNKEHYRLTHLLENGHVIKNGTGRTYGSTGQFVHIAPAEEKAVDELEKRIKEAIEG